MRTTNTFWQSQFFGKKRDCVEINSVLPKSNVKKSRALGGKTQRKRKKVYVQVLNISKNSD